MPVVPIILPSFAAGELSPFLYGRVDLDKYHVGARVLQNFLVHAHGGVSNRPGTRFIGEVTDSSVRHRLIPFQFRTLPSGQTYILVFGDKTMEVALFNGDSWGFVENGDGSRFVLATPYAAADLPLLKFLQSADTMTLCHPNYSVRSLTRAAANSWTLKPITFAPSTAAPTGLFSTSPGSATYIEVTAINDATGEESLPSAPAGSSNGTAGVWDWSLVPGCTNYNVYMLSGSVYGFIAQVQQPTWTDNNLAPDIGNTPPGSRTPFGTNLLTSATVVNGGSGYSAPTGRVFDGGLVLTTVSFTTSSGVITSATLANTTKQASPNAFLQITDGTGSGAVLQPIISTDPTTGIPYISGATVINGGSGYQSNTQVHTVYAGVIDFYPQAFAVTTSGGVITAVTAIGEVQIDSDPVNQAAISLVVTDSAGSGAVIKLNVTSDPDSGTSNPYCSTYYMQRQVYGATLNQPQGLWFTVVGAFGNMNVSTPTEDSDAITRSLTGQQVNEIRHLVPVGSSMLIMTSGAEWRCWPGPSSSALTPAACYTLPQTAHGASQVPPIQAGNDVLFVKEKGSRVMALRYDAIQDLYQSFDMSILSQHLLYDTAGTHQIQEWTFATEPDQIIWCVRDDGIALGFTYMREHDVYAWHRHITDGLIESVASITEPDGYGGYEDAVYFMVNRTIGGVTHRYLERLVSRTFPTIADAWFVDCGLQYDGWNTDPTQTLQISGASYDSGDTVTLTAVGFVPTAGTYYTIEGADGESVIVSATSSTTATIFNDAAPASTQAIATAHWAAMVTQLTNVTWLAGKTVAILGDGSMVPPVTVDPTGTVALDGPYIKVTVGLPYEADLETLNLELAPSGGTSQGQMKKIAQVTARMKDTRGAQIGLVDEVPIGAFAGSPVLVEVKQRTSSVNTLGTAMQPYTGDWQVSVPSGWNKGGRLFVRQSYPLPCTVLDLVPQVNPGA
jgi:hypothetical protein